MIYIEFIERDRSMPIEIFRQLGRQSSDWAEGSEDRLVLQLGRTLRLGPTPSYLALWEIPGIERLDAWEAYFESPEALMNRRSQAMHRAIHIQRAGLYDSVIMGSRKSFRFYYVVYYRKIGPDVLNDNLMQSDREQLVCVLRRVGWLAPEPEGIVIWGCKSYRDIEHISRNHHEGVMDAGVYKEFGAESL